MELNELIIKISEHFTALGGSIRSLTDVFSSYSCMQLGVEVFQCVLLLIIASKLEGLKK